MTVGCFLKIMLKDYTDYGFRIWYGDEFKIGDKYSSPQFSDDEEPVARIMEDFADYEIVNGSIEMYVRHNRPWIEMRIEN